MKNVLVATDLSSSSDLALQRATLISQALDAKLNVLHVVDDRYMGNIADTITSFAEAKLKDKLQKELSMAQLRDTDIFIVSGEPDVEILRHAEKLKAVCTILGMHRKLTLELFSGTTADRVCRYNHGLTLLARNAVIKPYQRVLCAADFSRASQHAMQGAAVLAPNASFTAVHFEESLAARSEFLASAEQVRHVFMQEIGQQLQADVEKVFGKKAKDVKTEIVNTAPLEGVIVATKAQRVDLIALGKHSKSGIKLATLGSLARALLSNPPCDVLVAGT